MTARWSAALERWVAAGLIDRSTADRIGAWEVMHGEQSSRGRLAAIAFGLGALLLIAGVLLFVASHWDEISPGARFALVLSLTAMFHVGGALTAAVHPILSTTLHAVGTGALGAGIFLTGQIFHIAEHWPAALMLWALGAAAGFALLRSWPQLLWLAVLVPAWLWGEWEEITRYGVGDTPAATGLVLLAVAYLATADGSATPWRKVLMRLGAVALIPAAAYLAVTGYERGYWAARDLERTLVPSRIALAWAVAILLPAVVVFLSRRQRAVHLLGALIWAITVGAASTETDLGELALHSLLAAGAVAVVLWGLQERQRLHVNIGVLGFALTVLSFYFSSVFDKLGRSLGLIGLGIIFVGGGWLLERTRRSLVSRVAQGMP